MVNGWLLSLLCIAYVGLLFYIANRVESSPSLQQRTLSSPHVYALSLGVYATAWTFYGSIGLAASSGLLFLAIYLGPTLASIIWVPALARIIQICRHERINSIADFIAARYGKSAAISALITIIALVGLTPYLAVQLKAISVSADLITGGNPGRLAGFDLTTLLVALALALFAVVFGTRHIDVTERHAGMVATVAFESLVKLFAFLVVALFIVYGLFGGFGDIFSRASQSPEMKQLFFMNPDSAAAISWPWLLLLAAIASIALPRQFQMAVLENDDVTHLRKAAWLFPGYLLLFNIFVLPIALAGLILLPAGSPPDGFLISLPLSASAEVFATIAFLGGFSAATAMVIVETLALATMFSNNLVMPILLRIPQLNISERKNVSRLLLQIRRSAIIAGVLLAYLYTETLGKTHSLVGIGLVSFVAVAQFAPVLIAALYWRNATRHGAFAGLMGGFLLWLYTLVVPHAIDGGLLPLSLVTEGPFGIGWLSPIALFGMEYPMVAHATFWTLLVNSTLLVTVSLLTRPSPAEQEQALRFIGPPMIPAPKSWSPRHVTSHYPELYALLVRVIGQTEAERAANEFNRDDENSINDEDFARFVETAIAAIVGAPAARVMVATVMRHEPLIDGLTGLPNRDAFLGYLSEAINQRSEQRTPFVTVLRLDRYRAIVNGFGEEAGNVILRRSAYLLHHHAGDQEQVARIGTDEFAVLDFLESEFDDPCHIASHLQQRLLTTLELSGQLLSTGASAGCAICDPGLSSEQVLRNAQTALAEAESESGGCALFDPEMVESMARLIQMETHLRNALQRDEFQIRYQPIIRLDNGRLIGFEALLRWIPEHGTLISPATFIPLCEKTGLIVPIGNWVTEQACKQLAQWKEMLPDTDLQVSVNLSPRQFTQPDLIDVLQETLERHSLPPGSLKVEVTESTLISDADRALDILLQMRALGITLLLDDFGTGYSSLSYLQRFPMDILKIDQSFVRRYGAGNASPIAEAAATLAQKMGMKVIAEGIEQHCQYRWLRGLGVEYGQGYYFGRPMNARRASQLVRRAARRRSETSLNDNALYLLGLH